MNELTARLAQDPGQSKIHDTEAEVIFDVQVRFPRHLVAAFAAAFTGDDDDIILAGEKAMRERLGDLSAEVELYPPAYLADILAEELDNERRCQQLYGPPA